MDKRESKQNDGVKSIDKEDDGQEQVTELIIRCLVDGLPLNQAKKVQTSSQQLFVTQQGKQECAIHPSSVLHASQRHMFKDKTEEKSAYEKQLNPAQHSPQDYRCLIYSEVIETTRTYVRFVTDVSDYVK